MRSAKRMTALLLAAILLFASASCGANTDREETMPSQETIAAETPDAATAEKNGDVCILFTSDVH